MPKTQTRPLTVDAVLQSAPRFATQIEGATYMGCCIVQAPAAWARLGPTWLDERGRWWTIGPGVAEWGTTRGLAQLAHEGGCKTRWHAMGLACVPKPNIVFFCLPSIHSEYPAEVQQLIASAEGP